MKILHLLMVLSLTAACGGDFFGKKSADDYFLKTKSIEDPTGIKVVVEPKDPNDDSAVRIVENFSQNEKNKLDIVWVIDNSGSMSDEQAALGSNFDAFIKDFVDTDVDFKMAIITTDVREGIKGVMVPGSDVKLTSQAAKDNRTQFIDDFNSLVRVGIAGSGYEKGLEASEGFLNLNGAAFLRPEAYLVFVILSDEEDQSPQTPLEYVNFLKAAKSLNPGLVKIYSIVDESESNSGSGVTIGYKRYAEASKVSGGAVANIRNDFHQVLTDMSLSIMNLLDSFAISSEPVPGSLKVYVNNVLVTNYTYDEKSRSVKFNANAVPPVGTSIKITYLKQ